MDRKLSFYGVGVMGSAVLGGVLASGHRPDDVRVTDRYADTAAAVADEHGVQAVDATDAAREGDLHVIAVKPADVAGLLDEIAPHLGDGDVVVSLAAGIGTAAIEEPLPEGVHVVRVMPNTPALVGEGMAAVAGGARATDADVDLVVELMSACGDAVAVKEKDLDAVTGVSGSGPAYVFYLAEAMIEGGVLEGLTRPVATRLAVQTILGAARMMAESDDSATVLRERVSSPGGTTIAALHHLDERAVRAAVAGAVRSAARRSAELGS